MKTRRSFFQVVLGVLASVPFLCRFVPRRKLEERDAGMRDLDKAIKEDVDHLVAGTGSYKVVDDRTIKFGIDGGIIDGQHRLRARVKGS